MIGWRESCLEREYCLGRSAWGVSILLTELHFARRMVFVSRKAGSALFFAWAIGQLKRAGAPLTALGVAQRASMLRWDYQLRRIPISYAADRCFGYGYCRGSEQALLTAGSDCLPTWLFHRPRRPIVVG